MKDEENMQHPNGNQEEYESQRPTEGIWTHDQLLETLLGDR